MPSGRVYLTDGKVFEGAVTRDGDAVTLVGQVRTARLVDGEKTIVFGPTVTRIWPLARISEIRLDD